MKWYVESGDGQRLSVDSDETTARALARDIRERLIRYEDGSAEQSNDLIFDYGVDYVGPDDIGARHCDECGKWSVEMVSSSHTTSCSLFEGNVI